MKPRISCDDGAASDVRLAALLEKYGFYGTFYFPVEWRSLAYDNGYEPLTFEEAVKISKLHEIGSHTVTHRHLTKISTAEACIEIMESKLMLEEMFDREITKFCPPRGYSTPELTEFTLQFYDSQRLTKGKGLVHVHPNSGANNNMHWLDYAKTIDVEELWLHSWELDKYPEEWINLEKYLALHS